MNWTYEIEGAYAQTGVLNMGDVQITFTHAKEHGMEATYQYMLIAQTHNEQMDKLKNAIQEVVRSGVLPDGDHPNGSTLIWLASLVEDK